MLATKRTILFTHLERRPQLLLLELTDLGQQLTSLLQVLM
jgi:hypothetical protein